jgi:hypothetical protein
VLSAKGKVVQNLQEASCIQLLPIGVALQQATPQASCAYPQHAPHTPMKKWNEIWWGRDKLRRASDVSCRYQVMLAQNRLGLNQRSEKTLHPVSRGLDYTAPA